MLKHSIFLVSHPKRPSVTIIKGRVRNVTRRGSGVGVPIWNACLW